MGAASHEILKEAVARHRAAVLSVRKGKTFEHYKSRFLGEDAAGLWIASPPEIRKAVDEAIAAQAPAAVAFKSGPNKVMFATRLLRRDAEYSLGVSLAEAILLATPEQVEGVQRRADYRVDVAAAIDEGDLTARVWRISEHHLPGDRPDPDDELTISLRDLSVSGVGLFCAPEDGEPVGIRVEERLRVSLRYKGIEISADGRVRHFQVNDQQITRVGVLFAPIEQADLQRQRTTRLELMVGALRKDEMRRLRGQLLSTATGHSPAA